MRHHPALPFVAAASGIATFSIMDALMKSAAIIAGVYTALMWRSTLGAVLGFAVWRMVTGGPWPDRHRLALHAARACVTCGMAFTFFWGLVRTPMAVGMALSFIAPIIALFMAAIMLGEAVTRRALVASVLGLGGVVVIATDRVGAGLGSDSGLGMLAILGSAVLYAINLVMQRHQAQLAAPAEIAFFQSLFMALLLGLGCILPDLRAQAIPPAGAWRDIAGGAALATVSLMLLSWGWARAPAHRLLPIEYTGFIWAAVTGYLWFDEGIGASTLVGVALIVAGCWHGTAGGTSGGGKKPEDAPEQIAHTEQTAL